MALRECFGARLDPDRMVAQFMEMVQVDSESGEEAAFLAWLLPVLRDLGARAGLGARSGGGPMMSSRRMTYWLLLTEGSMTNLPT